MIVMKTKAESSSDKENENDYIDSGDRDELSDVILAFIDDEEEVERPATPRLGRAITRRSFLFADFIVYTVKSDRCNCNIN